MTLTEKYHLVLEGKMSKQHFSKEAVRDFSAFVTPNNSFTDIVNILKNKNIISENVRTLNEDSLKVNDKLVKTYTQNGDKSYNVVYDDGGKDVIMVSHNDWDKINTLHKNVSETNKLSGGKGDKLNYTDVDAEQLKAGIAVEMEHTNDPTTAEEIALDHLSENPKYYTDLKSLEAKEKNEAFGSFKGYVDLHESHNKKPMLDADHVNPYELKKGNEYEMCKTDDPEKARKKVLANLNKDPLFYTRLLTNTKLSTKRTDLPVELNKKGDNVVDKLNAVKAVSKVEKSNVKDKKDKLFKTKTKEMTMTPQKQKGVKVMDIPSKKSKKISLKEALDKTSFEHIKTYAKNTSNKLYEELTSLEKTCNSLTEIEMPVREILKKYGIGVDNNFTIVTNSRIKTEIKRLVAECMCELGMMSETDLYGIAGDYDEEQDKKNSFKKKGSFEQRKKLQPNLTHSSIDVDLFLQKVAQDLGEDSKVYEELYNTIMKFTNNKSELISNEGVEAISDILDNYDLLDKYLSIFTSSVNENALKKLVAVGMLTLSLLSSPEKIKAASLELQAKLKNVTHINGKKAKEVINSAINEPTGQIVQGTMTPESYFKDNADYIVSKVNASDKNEAIKQAVEEFKNQDTIILNPYVIKIDGNSWIIFGKPIVNELQVTSAGPGRQEPINQPDYKFYVYSFEQKKLLAGNEFIEDAKDAVAQMPPKLGKLGVYSKKYITSKLNLNPNNNSSWGTDMVKENFPAPAPPAKPNQPVADVKDDIKDLEAAVKFCIGVRNLVKKSWLGSTKKFGDSKQIEKLVQNIASIFTGLNLNSNIWMDADYIKGLKKFKDDIVRYGINENKVEETTLYKSFNPIYLYDFAKEYVSEDEINKVFKKYGFDLKEDANLDKQAKDLQLKTIDAQKRALDAKKIEFIKTQKPTL